MTKTKKKKILKKISLELLIGLKISSNHVFIDLTKIRVVKIEKTAAILKLQSTFQN